MLEQFEDQKFSIKIRNPKKHFSLITCHRQMQFDSKLLQTDILVANSILDFKSVDHVTYMYFTDQILMKNTVFITFYHITSI